MKVYSIKTFFLHLAIAATYLAFTSSLFVVRRDPNPIGAGLQQWLCIFLHVTITLFVMLTFSGRTADKKGAAQKLLLHIAAIVLAIAPYSLFSNPIWNWLWSLR